MKALSAAAAIFTFSTICPSSFGSEAPLYGVFYGTQYEQWNGSLTPWTVGAFAFEAWVRARPAGQVTTTRLTAPTGSQQSMADEPHGAYLVIPFPQEALRNMLFPPGNYTFTERLTTGANRTHTLSLSAGAAPPPAKFLDTTGWDSWPARKPLRVDWEPGAGTLPTDTFVLAVHDMTGIQKLFESPGPGEANALTAATTSFTIPGECLTNAGSLLVRIACYRCRGAVPELTGTYASTFGRFTLVAEAANPVSRYHLVAGRVFEQDGDNAPVLLASNPYKVEAYLCERTLGQVLQARVQPPGKTATTLDHVDGDMDWRTTSMHVSSADLSAAWPAGNYKWTIDQVLGGTQEAVQTVGQPGTVSPLRILNLSQLRTNTFEEDTTLQWVPTGIVSAEDRIEFIVRDKTGKEILRLPDPWVPEWLPPPIITGEATSLVIDDNDLPANQELFATLRYIHVAQRTTNTFGGAEAISGHFAETRFRIGEEKPVGPAPLKILATPLEPGTAGAYYVAQLAASGGTRPFTWTSASGNVPPGLNLSMDGALQGTPTLAGDYSFTVMVRDASNQVAQASFAMTVNGTVPPLYIATTNLPMAHGSWPYLTELSSGGGLEPVKWELVSGQLPRGVMLHKEHGIISGTPTEGGNFNVSVRLTDAAGTTRQRTFSLNVTEPEQPLLALSTCELITPRLLALELNAEPGEPVSIEHSTDCVSWTTLAAADYLSVNRFEVALSEGAAGFYRARWGRAPQPANPPGPVKPELDTNLVVSATYEGTNPLSLALTNTLSYR